MNIPDQPVEIANVGLSLRGGWLAEITVNRPERHNAMTAAMYEALQQVIGLCRADARVRCVTFRGVGGKSFISGTDIAHFKDFDKGADGIAYEAFVESVVDAVERIEAPTVAIIDGWAVGGGLALATACDFRVCSESAKFGAPIAKTLSNTLSSRNIARLHSAFGAPRVKRMLMLAEYLNAPDALACGYVHACCAPAELHAAASALAERLAALSPVTQGAVKESLRRLVVEQRLDDEDLVEAVYGSPEFRKGVATFLA